MANQRRSILWVCLIFMVGFAVSGCAGNATLVPQPIAGQLTESENDRVTLISEKQNIVKLEVSLPKSVNSNRAELLVAVKNQSDEAFYFAQRSISAKAIFFRDAEFLKNPMDNLAALESLVQTKPLKIFTYPELMEEERQRYVTTKMVAGWNSMARDIIATSGGTYAGYDYGLQKRQDARQFAKQQTKAEVAYMRSEHEEKVRTLSKIMRGQSIAPGQWYGGVIVIETPDAEDEPIPLRIHVQAGDETHMFTYFLQKLDR